MALGFRIASAAALPLALMVVSCPGAELSDTGRGSQNASVVVRKPARKVRKRKRAQRSPRPLPVAAVPAADQAGTWPEPSEAELDALASDSVKAERPVPARALAALGQQTFIFKEPRASSTKLGYLRAGAIVARSDRPAGYGGCPGGWYRIKPEGYVCIGGDATLEVEEPLVHAARARADRQAALPYRYGMSLFPTPPLYTRVPTLEEQQRVEPELAARAAKGTASEWKDVPLEPIPEFFSSKLRGQTPSGFDFSPRTLHRGRALVKSGFAFLSFFEADGRRFGVSTDLDVMPLDRMRAVEASSFAGLPLADGIGLPVVFTTTRGSVLLAGQPGRGLRSARALGYREALPVTGKRVQISGQEYFETTHGEWVKNDGLVFVGPMRNRPGWASPGRTWIDISILKQTLIAYEGETPVYVTLVSTGIDGLEDPEETHATIRGQFLIHTKHVTATMSGDEVGDEYDLRDVPYVMYFNEGYALHAAYWHDAFGRPRSHGCVNLSPLDARWIFEWSDPPVPEAWHAALSLQEGTLVYIHP
jgi:hypothetical protein